ncbi:MAG: ZIP family metal transporter, partial [Luteibacter sp.]
GAGAAILLAGALFAGRQAWASLSAMGPAVSGALAGGLLAAGATALGTLPVVLSKQFSARANSMMLGFGAGVMLAASVFSLIVPALSLARSQGSSPWTAGMLVACGILLGAGLLYSLGRTFGHDQGGPGVASGAINRAWMFVAAITLHNIPEGAAIGVAFAGMDRAAAAGLATGIGIQDIPEGLAVALALRSVGKGRVLAVACGMASGLVEPIFAVLGALIVTTSAALLPWGLAAAAGAMLFVIANDVIPETHSKGQGTTASAALMAGFVVMLLLDTALA